MITIIIFLLGVLITYGINILVFIDSMRIWTITWVCYTAILTIIAINGVIAIICCKALPDKWFIGDKKIYNPSKREIKLYDKLKIKAWKDKTLDLGMLNGFRKNKLNEPDNPEYIKRFLIENNKGFITHFVSVIASILAIFLMPQKFWLPMALPIAITSCILNLLPVMILRYNMPRLKTLLRFSERVNK